MAELTRVVHLINGLGRGGGERLLVELIRGSDRGLCESAVYALTRRGPLAAELEALGVPVRRLTRRGVPLLWEWVQLLVDLRRSSVLHTHFFYSDLVGSVLGRLARVPRRVASRHETGFWMTPPHRWLEPWVYRGFHRVLCVSNAVATAMAERGVSRSLLTVVTPGVVAAGAPVTRRVETNAPYLLAVGRLERVKGHDLLLQALARLKGDARLAAWRLKIVGGGRQLAYLRRLAERLGVSERCELLGDLPVGRVGELLLGASLFVLPSRSEAAPLSLMEAMACGLPCIAARVGGIPELVTDGVDGWLVEPEDPEALAHAIETLALDPERAGRIGEGAARSARERFGLETYVRAVLATYASGG